MTDGRRTAAQPAEAAAHGAALLRPAAGARADLRDPARVRGRAASSSCSSARTRSTAYWALLRGMWAPDRIAASLGRSTPFIGAALAVAFAFRAGLFNIGVEGQLLDRRDRGGVGRHVGVDRRPAGGRSRCSSCSIAGVVGGGLYGAIPGVLEGAHRRARGDHDDHAQQHRGALRALAGRLAGSRDPARHERLGAAHARPPEGRAPARVRRQPASAALQLPHHARRSCVFVWFVLQRTTTGFEIRMVGANPNAARYAGVSVGRVIVLVMAMSGAFAGLAGAGEITGTSGFLSPGVFVADRLRLDRDRAARARQPVRDRPGRDPVGLAARRRAAHAAGDRASRSTSCASCRRSCCCSSRPT